jgi:hypothetical protein
MILVAQGATRDFNPELPQSVIDRAMDRDPAPQLPNILRSSEPTSRRSSPERPSRSVFNLAYSSGHRSGSIAMSPSSILLAAQAMR